MQKTDFEKFAYSKGIGSLTLNDYQKIVDNGGYINPTIMEERVMNVTQMDVFSRMMIDRIIFLGTDIDATSANIISAQLQWLESQNNSDITIEISSNGGSIYDGYKILDTIQYINCNVSTICMGMVASMATVIASSGTRGKRLILPHSRFLIHQPMSGISAGTQSSDIQIHAREIDTLKTELTQILTDNTYGKVTYEEMERMCDRDTILTAQQTLEKGFVDEIITSKKL
jgi:ATP-dependent Clp protease, protease subunit